MELKQYVACTCVFSIVVYKYCYQEEPCTIVLFPTNERLKISLHCAVLLLGLAVCLQIKIHRKLPLDAKKLAQQQPKFQDKQSAPVANYELWQAMVLYSYIDDNLC